MIDRHGADAFRWYFLTSKQPWDGYLFSVDAVGESLRQFLLQLWNTYGFYVMYANVNGVDAGVDGRAGERPRPLGAVAARATVETVTRAARRLRRDARRPRARGVRRRPLELVRAALAPALLGRRPGAFATLRTCLVTVSKLLAPFCPFMADEIYDNLDGPEPSVHLTDWPEAARATATLEDAMAVVRETVRLGLAARAGSPSSRSASRCAPRWSSAGGEERAAIERLADVALEELNVKELRYVSQADELGSYEVKPNYRALGPRFGKQMPQVAAAVAALDPEHVARALREAEPVGIRIDGHDHELGPDDLMLAMKPLEGYQLEREGSHAVALELELDEELRREGLAREIVHASRTPARGPGSRSRTGSSSTLGGDEELLAAARAFEGYLAARDAGGHVAVRGAAATRAAAGHHRAASAAADSACRGPAWATSSAPDGR